MYCRYRIAMLQYGVAEYFISKLYAFLYIRRAAQDCSMGTHDAYFGRRSRMAALTIASNTAMVIYVYGQYIHIIRQRLS